MSHDDGLRQLADQLWKVLVESTGESQPGATARERIAQIVDRRATLLGAADRARLRELLEEQSFGLGPLQPLIADQSVDEIMVNGCEPVWVERRGAVEPTPVCFDSEAQLRATIERILAPLGRRVDESTPLVDGRLSDGSRVNVVIPPLAVDGPILTIRRFRRANFLAAELVQLGALSQSGSDFLERCVQARLNILVSGGTGAGKTTLLNVLSSFIPAAERIVTIEDAAELRLQQPHVVRLEARPPNLEGNGAITMRELVRNALRMRPDRIVVGETRGGEALDMLSAMSTGHDGSLSTVHAGSPAEALRRVETLALMADVELPLQAIRNQIAGALDLIVHQARLPGGRRAVTAISEVCCPNDQPVAGDLFHQTAAGLVECGEPSPELQARLQAVAAC